MQIIIDRFEGDYAVVELENKNFINLPRALVPIDAREGNRLEIRLLPKVADAETENLIDSLFKD